MEASSSTRKDARGSCATSFTPLTDRETQPSEAVAIVDIRSDGKPLDLASPIRSKLHSVVHDGCRTLPDLLLWNGKGLQYFKDVMNSPQYYLTDVEIGLLEEYSRDIAEEHIRSGTLLLELGSGSLQKTGILLRALEAARKQVDYYALDLDRNELARTLHQMKPDGFKYVRCHGLLGTYDDGRAWIGNAEHQQKPKCVLSLGSKMGDYTRSEASEFGAQWCRALQGKGSQSGNEGEAQLIIGLDGCKDANEVFNAYNDSDGANANFILNALEHANEHLQYGAFDRHEWDVRGEWDAGEGRHSQYLIPTKDVTFEKEAIARGEKILLVHSHKYSDAEKRRLWNDSNLEEVDSYLSSDGSYGMYFVKHFMDVC